MADRRVRQILLINACFYIHFFCNYLFNSFSGLVRDFSQIFTEVIFRHSFYSQIFPTGEVINDLYPFFLFIILYCIMNVLGMCKALLPSQKVSPTSCINIAGYPILCTDIAANSAIKIIAGDHG